ncbi:MAG: cytochrome C oxidase subunit IV family protein [Candidatus Margulisiibacteriota bacterium]
MSQHHGHSHHFIVPIKYYIFTFVSLLVLTVLTVVIAQFNFGEWNIIIALAVAMLKAAMVAMFFMGLRWDKGFNRIAFLSSLIFLGIFLFFTMADISFRGDMDRRQEGNRVSNSPVKLIKPGQPLNANEHE